MKLSTIHQILARTASTQDYTQFLALVKDLHAIEDGYVSWEAQKRLDPTAESAWDLVLTEPGQIDMRVRYQADNCMVLAFCSFYQSEPNIPVQTVLFISYDNDDVVDVSH